jgi:hypothetical protein
LGSGPYLVMNTALGADRCFAACVADCLVLAGTGVVR